MAYINTDLLGKSKWFGNNVEKSLDAANVVILAEGLDILTVTNQPSDLEIISGRKLTYTIEITNKETVGAASAKTAKNVIFNFTYKSVNFAVASMAEPDITFNSGNAAIGKLTFSQSGSDDITIKGCYTTNHIDTGFNLAPGEKVTITITGTVTANNQ